MDRTEPVGGAGAAKSGQTRCAVNELNVCV